MNFYEVNLGLFHWMNFLQFRILFGTVMLFVFGELISHSLSTVWNAIVEVWDSAELRDH